MYLLFILLWQNRLWGNDALQGVTSKVITLPLTLTSPNICRAWACDNGPGVWPVCCGSITTTSISAYQNEKNRGELNGDLRFNYLLIGR